MITKEKLENYLSQGLTKNQIAEQEGVLSVTVRGWIRKYKLGNERRSLKNCVVCGKHLCGSQTKFCSKACCCRVGNEKHQTYSEQQKRGVKRKLELIALRGSKCEECGYSKNLAALQFHHLNPNEKESQMDMRKLSNSKWEWCLEELSKCRVLCSNCHAETHHPHLDLEKLLGAAGIEPALSGLSSQP
jgi:transposase-like protein